MAGIRETGKDYDKLTKRQKAWLAYYREGKTQTEAAKLAGYQFPNTSGYQNMRTLGNFIAGPEEQAVHAGIASLKEAKEFFTRVMRDEELNIKDRFKAGEILIKLESGFSEKESESWEEAITVEFGEAEKYGD